MASHSRRSSVGLAALLVLCLIAPASADTLAYCSSQNTANDLAAAQHDWQSHGWCSTHCNAGQYAFAVIQEKSCYCSNYVPDDQQDTSDCDLNCPGFPTEKCGNTEDNLYSYIKLKNEPSGTVGGSQPTSTEERPSSAATSATEARPPPETSTSPTSTSTSTPTTAPTTFQTTILEGTAPPSTSVRIITQSGTVVTETVINSPTPAPAQQTSKSNSNTGAIVGGAVGGVAGVLAAVGLVFFALWRRKRRQNQDVDPQTGVVRNTSTMSKSGLLRTEKMPQYPPPIMTSFNRRQSRNMDQDSISPISGSDRRNSRHLVDQRLNPSAMFVFDNNSTNSIGTVDDSRDYHRPLNVRNPDPIV